MSTSRVYSVLIVFSVASLLSACNAPKLSIGDQNAPVSGVTQQWIEQNDWLSHQQDGDFLLYVQRFDKAEEAFKTAIKKADDARFKDARVARSLTGLARVYLTRRQFENAITKYEQALDIKRRAYGDDHYDVADILTELAFAEASLGRLERARGHVERATTVYKNHKADVGTELLYVDAFLNAQEGKPTVAEKKYKQATERLILQIDVHRYPQPTRSMRLARDCAEQYANLLDNQGKKDVARAFRERVKPINEWMMILGESGA